MLPESIIMGIPAPRKMADMMKKRVMALVSVGMGSHALSICCLKDYAKVLFYYEVSV